MTSSISLIKIINKQYFIGGRAMDKVIGLSAQRPELAPRLVHMGFMVERVSRG
jgi:hypothetical protein